MKSIALIVPDGSKDYLTYSVLEGFRSIEADGQYKIRISPRFDSIADYSDWELDDIAFLEYAKTAELIIFMKGKYTTNDLVKKIGLWDKTVCIDGDEVGKNNRYDFTIQRDLILGTYKGQGAIQYDLYKKAKRYYRREKPYLPGMIVFPFPIEKRYIAYTPGQKKDIDIACIFGNDQYPLMRRYCRELVEKFCTKYGFTCATSNTKGLFDRDQRSLANSAKFHDILARSKIGVSVGGGGYDTPRFWEMMGNNCVILNETRDIYNPDSDAMNYKRIFEFKNLFDFEFLLEHTVKDLLRSGRVNDYLDLDEYNAILKKHSAEARVREVLDDFFGQATKA